ncbi:MAG TPA: hypothetical protein EYP85_11860 [Armatimonadetes bacterium]|nr:hypothetical protein [Armatimonadota bacterium]
MRLLVFTDESEESQRQKQIAWGVARRFPQVEVVELPLTGEEAQRRGIPRAPAVVAEGFILSVGKLLSAGQLRRFLERKVA